MKMRQINQDGRIGKGKFASAAVLTSALLLSCASQQTQQPQSVQAQPTVQLKQKQEKQEAKPQEKSQPAQKIYGSIETTVCPDAPEEEILVNKTTSVWIAKTGDSFGYEIPLKLPVVDGARIHKVYGEDGVDILVRGMPGEPLESSAPTSFGFGEPQTFGEFCDNVTLTFERKSDKKVKLRIEQIRQLTPEEIAEWCANPSFGYCEMKKTTAVRMEEAKSPF